MVDFTNISKLLHNKNRSFSWQTDLVKLSQTMATGSKITYFIISVELLLKYKLKNLNINEKTNMKFAISIKKVLLQQIIMKILKYVNLSLHF